MRLLQVPVLAECSFSRFAFPRLTFLALRSTSHPQAIHKPQETMCSPAAWVLMGVTLAGLLLEFGPAPALGAHALPIRVWSQIEREAKSAGFELVTLFKLFVILRAQTVSYLITFRNYQLIKANVLNCS